MAVCSWLRRLNPHYSQYLRCGEIDRALATKLEFKLQSVPKHVSCLNGLLCVCACLLILLWVLQKSALTATVMICTGSVADNSNMVASVRKAGENRAVIELEKRVQTKYVAEGSLLQCSYIITQNGQQVAQVLLLFTCCLSLCFMQIACTAGKTCPC